MTAELLTRVQKLALAWVLRNDNAWHPRSPEAPPRAGHRQAAAAGRRLPRETLAGIDDILSDAVERDGSLLGSMSPKNRHT